MFCDFNLANMLIQKRFPHYVEKKQHYILRQNVFAVPNKEKVNPIFSGAKTIFSGGLEKN